ncbi:hypothetical protein [Carbonactinospora thermoautotrophica]|uniref:hypothetical protein n=1 Tax=Carbonactinospora thermoautotrophica TaxID=1469144 RepID=UPI003DA9B792
MTGSTLGEIRAAFEDEGFAPNPDSTWQDTSERRILTQAYLEAVDWTDIHHVNRVLRVFERLVHGFDPQDSKRFLDSLRRDGYVVDEETGHITPIGPRFSLESLKNLTDASAIRQQLSRIQRAIIDDPALAIGSAKELIESTAKVVLKERGLPVDDKADLPALVRDAQQALRLYPSPATPGPDGSDAVKKIVLVAPTRGRNTSASTRPRPRTGRSSSPLRGVATREGQSLRPGSDPVLIAPTRGRNKTIKSYSPASGASPHRPYEGSQRQSADPHAAAVAGPHRPYKGSQATGLAEPAPRRPRGYGPRRG